MSKKRSTLRIYSEYALLKSLAGLVMLMPERLAYLFGQGLGKLLHLVDGRHRAVAKRNISAAYPDMPPEEVARLTRKVYEHLGLTVVESLRIRKILREGIEKYVEIPDLSEYKALLDEGKGVIIATGHIGNWELAGHAASLLLTPLHSVARRLDNPLLEEYVDSVRRLSGQKVIEKRGAARDMVRVLKKGGAVVVLMDQDARKRGVLVNFFGRLASTWPSAAALSLKLGSPVLLGFVRRKPGRFRYELVVDSVLRPEPTGNNEVDVATLTQKITSRLEAHIRECPEQWFWVHRRWKTEPTSEQAEFALQLLENQA